MDASPNVNSNANANANVNANANANASHNLGSMVDVQVFANREKICDRARAVRSARNSRTRNVLHERLLVDFQNSTHDSSVNHDGGAEATYSSSLKS